MALAALVFAPACDSGDDGDSSGEQGDTSGGGGSGDGDGDGDGDGGGGGGDGTTACGAFGPDTVTCQAGQYCADPVLFMCENGCLNNDNCAADQTCEKESGQDVGTCQNKPGAGPTEAAFCDKLLVCDPTVPMTECSMVYAGTSETCHQCIVDNNCGDILDFDGICDEACGFF